MKHKQVRRSVALTLALALTAGIASQGLVSAADTQPFKGVGERGENQPTMHGYRVHDILNWDPATDLNAQYMRAQVPLQKRNEAFEETQANPNLSSDTQFFNLAGDYGNAFFESYQSNDNFSNYLFNFWQYTDYYGSWHGQTTQEVPTDLWDTSKDWEYRFFEFGILNMPNPAYTNAAHKNGVLSIGCLYLPRDGQSASPMLEKAEDGTFPVADKLIEMCRYYGFDGFFINQEENISSEEVIKYQEFMKYMRDAGLYIQWYDSATSPNGRISYQNAFNSKNSPFVYNETYGRVSDSIFLNYWWDQSKINSSVAHAQSIGVDPLETVFFGLEGGMYRWNQPYHLEYLFGEDNNPVASIAILGTDFVHHGMAEDIKSLPTYAFSDPEYQWIAFERERIWFSGPEQDPTNPEINTSIDNSQVTGASSSNVAGIADYISERSVVSGTEFYTNFNTGHGMQYFKDGEVSNDNEWSNMNLQDILPTWQWWLETSGDKLSVNFDYGEKYNKGPLYDYQSVGGYEGGSSLVVNGTLNAENFLHLYKTDLAVSKDSKVSITYNKVSADDASAMEVGIIFKNSPDEVYTINVPNSGKQTDGWVTKTVQIDDAYAGEEIAAIGINFKNNRKTIENYQMNIGELKVTEGADYTPAKPTGFALEKAFDTTEMYVKWDLDDYDEVKQYNLYAQLSDGTTRFVGGSYDNAYYIKSLYEEEDVAKLLLTAVGKDGSESEPAELSFGYGKNVSNIKYTANAGYIDFTWDAPASGDYDSIQVDVTFDATDKTDAYTFNLEKGATSARLWVPVGDGTRFSAAFSTVKDGVAGEPVVQSGRVNDYYSEPYQGGYYSYSGSTVTLNVPESMDWWHMYVYINGVQQFYNRKDGAQPFKTRGKSDILLKNVKDGDMVSIMLEDYNGNMSEPTTFTVRSNPDAEITAETFPDAILLEAVRTQIGTTFAQLDSFTGTLDLSNLDIQDYTGLNLIQAAEINLTGSNLDAIQQGTFNRNVGKVILANSEKLTAVYPNSFNGTDISEIDISGCTALQVLDLNNSNLEKITCTDPESFVNIVSVDLSGSKFDLSEGTPEKAFADAMSQQSSGKRDIELNATETVYAAGVQSGNQRPEATLNLDEVVRYQKTPNTVIDLNDALMNSTTVRGTKFADLVGAGFIDPDYDLKAAVKANVNLIKVTASDGSVNVNTVDLSADGSYTVEYITFNDADYHGKTLFTQKIYVRAVTSVLEAVIEKAEQLLNDGALDNTMEAVVTEFNGALKAAKEIVAKDGATQAEINDATVRLLNVMAKVDWKQGDKTALQVAVDIANAIKPDLDLYVESGKQEFLAALSTAEELLASGNAWDDDIKAATTELIEAMANLRMAANKDILNEMINKANALDLSAYTAESADAVRTALQAAEALAADENATQDKVDAAANTLQAALAGLTYVNGDSSTPAEDANSNSNSNGNGSTGTTTPVGDGTTPIKTGDMGTSGLAALMLMSAAGVLLLRKKNKR